MHTHMDTAIYPIIAVLKNQSFPYTIHNTSLHKINWYRGIISFASQR